ncbi:MAG: PEPxxWA-CTERM sorting domain-containing protein [Sphingobium sp.]
MAALVCLLTPAAGHAALIGTFDPIENSTIDYDYTVPTNGKTYRWIFNVFSADPNASVYLTPPTQVEGFLISPTAADFNYTFTSALSYIFHETVQPGQTTILVKGPKDYNNCNGGSPIGQTCGAFYNVWGNGTFLQLSATSPVTISFSALAAPEPEIWAMMIVGMAMIGAAKRKQVARRYAAKLAGSD